MFQLGLWRAGVIAVLLTSLRCAFWPCVPGHACHGGAKAAMLTVCGAVQFQHFISHWMAVMLAMITAQSIGLLLGASVQQFEKAQVVATVVILTLMLVGGFFARHIPEALFWLKCAPPPPPQPYCCLPQNPGMFPCRRLSAIARSSMHQPLYICSHAYACSSSSSFTTEVLSLHRQQH